MMQEEMEPYMTDMLSQLIAKLAAVSKVWRLLLEARVGLTVC